MFSNDTFWDIFTAANNVSRSHAIDSPMAGLVEGLSGMAVVVAFLIGIIIAVRKNLEVFQGVLENLQVILTEIVNAIRKKVTTTNPPLPPNELGPRNLTDDEIIEMRVMREQMDEHINRQTDRDASISVWI